ncbi:hypothetical protein NDI37_25210 [Funiculus sociatus GB2-A5]|uniref:Uncharacterized protein n=1 Tax=Funiculus sociatus GB2-A5 TaxID=2933946 RepID=A0ABV0JWD2_9CYAN|nr:MULTISPECIES: hypothetical protein [unclassified Trichocoleus]MBD1905520.1 hypothetical protein [Trichocoleus sp. FACHB-832]MBD2065051.1 hypothetical protein [Trichocoleus sp. FACHB-6]
MRLHFSIGENAITLWYWGGCDRALVLGRMRSRFVLGRMRSRLLWKWRMRSRFGIRKNAITLWYWGGCDRACCGSGECDRACCGSGECARALVLGRIRSRFGIGEGAIALVVEVENAIALWLWWDEDAIALYVGEDAILTFHNLLHHTPSKRRKCTHPDQSPATMVNPS